MDNALMATTGKPAPSVAGEPEHPLLGQRVLLVDRDVRAIYSISAMLDEQGLQVVPATSGAEALERFDEDAFDLALVDLSLTSGEGPNLIHQLRNDYGCQVPIVAMVANADSASRDDGMAAGADEVLAKPIDAATLVQLLRRVLSRADDPHDSP